jgi:hypothetical protein
MGSRTLEFQRRWAASYPAVELLLIRTNTATGGLAEGNCDLAVISSGRCIGITAESTLAQYRREGISFRPLRSAPPVPVRLIWRRHDPHPSTQAAIAMLAELYRQQP